jgi:hypothetical protein
MRDSDTCSKSYNRFIATWANWEKHWIRLFRSNVGCPIQPEACNMWQQERKHGKRSTVQVIWDKIKWLHLNGRYLHMASWDKSTAQIQSRAKMTDLTHVWCWNIRWSSTEYRLEGVSPCWSMCGKMLYWRESPHVWAVRRRTNEE